MKPVELLKLLDTGFVEEFVLYFDGARHVIDVRKPQTITLPNYDVIKLWNSEDGKGISVLLADAVSEDKI